MTTENRKTSGRRAGDLRVSYTFVGSLYDFLKILIACLIVWHIDPLEIKRVLTSTVGADFIDVHQGCFSEPPSLFYSVESTELPNGSIL